MKIQNTYKDIYKLNKDYFLAYCGSSDVETKVGECVLQDRTLKLVTKMPEWEKHTPKTLRTAIQDMKRVALKQGITKIAFDFEDSGIAVPNVFRNKEMLAETFMDTDIEIYICKQKKVRERV